MKQFDNIAGGTTLSLGPTDNLDDVLESHRDMVTPELRRAFDDPVACFRQMSEQTDIPTFAEWLKLSIRDEDWRLFLHEGYLPRRTTLAGFHWQAKSIVNAMVSLPSASIPTNLPPTLAKFYSIVGCVRWHEFGYGGGIDPANGFWEIDDELQHLNNRGIDLSDWFCWGQSSCGDMLIGSRDDKAAYLSHENGQLNRIHSMKDMLTWVFEMLLKGKTPEFNYGDDSAPALGLSNDDSLPASDTTRFQVSEEAWDRLNKLLDAPPRDLPRLRILVDEPSLFDEQEKDDDGEN